MYIFVCINIELVSPIIAKNDGRIGKYNVGTYCIVALLLANVSSEGVTTNGLHHVILSV